MPPIHTRDLQGAVRPLVELASLKARNIDAALEALQKQNEEAHQKLIANRDEAIAAVTSRFKELEMCLSSSEKEIRVKLMDELKCADAAVETARATMSAISEVRVRLEGVTSTCGL